jgi:RNA polymerase sigma factor (sigma-70 family)
MPIDSNKLGALLDGYWGILVEWVGGARDGAEDVVQSAFIKLASEEPAPQNCVAWLFTVSKRLAINEQVSQFKRRSRESRAATDRTRGSSGSVENIEIRELLNILEKREKEIVIARIWGGLTFDEIGDAIGEPKATIWRSYHSSISKLKQAYGESANEK